MIQQGIADMVKAASFGKTFSLLPVEDPKEKELQVNRVKIYKYF